jgi:nucleoid-associated protein YgaU
MRTALLLPALLLAACGVQRVRPPPAPSLPGLDGAAIPAATVAPRAPALLPAPAAASADESAWAADAHHLALAELEHQKTQAYTGLSDAQLDRVRIGELALARHQGHQALEVFRQLNQELAQAQKKYLVAAGDSLWVISGREAVYGNPWLWPLIWQANLDTLKDPNRLLVGQKLKIRPNPTIDEVVKAVDYAHADLQRRGVHIGVVREAQP